MAIAITESSISTSKLAWARNPVWWKLQASSYADKKSYYVKCEVGKVNVDTTLSTAFVAVQQTPAPDGSLTFQIEELIANALLTNYPKPDFTQEDILITDLPKILYVKFTEVADNIATPLSAIQFRALYAGLSEADFSLEAQKNFTHTKGKFLTSQPDFKITTYKAQEYLCFVNLRQENIDVWCRVTFEDQTSIEIQAFQDIEVGTKKLIIIPTSYSVLIEPTDNSNFVQTYSVWVSKPNNKAARLSEIFNYEMSEQSHLEAKTFIYRNSLGGYDTIICQGYFAEKYEGSSAFYKKIVPIKHNENFIGAQDLKRTGEAHTVWISKDYGFALADLAISTEIYEVTKSRFVAVGLERVEQTFESKNEELFGFSLEYTYLQEANNFVNDVNRLIEDSWGFDFEDLEPVEDDENPVIPTINVTLSLGSHGTANQPTTSVIPSGSDYAAVVTPSAGYEIDTILEDGVPLILTNFASYTISRTGLTSNKLFQVAFRLATVVPVGFTVTINNSPNVRLRLAGYNSTEQPAGQNASLTVNAGGSVEVWIKPLNTHNVVGITVNSVAETGVDPNERTAEYGLTISNIQSNQIVNITEALLSALQHKVTVNSGPGGSTNKTGINLVAYQGNFSVIVTPQSGFEIDTVKPSNGAPFTISNRAGQTFTVNGVAASFSIAVTFRALAVVLPFYTDIRNNLQIQSNNNVSALVSTVPSARSRQTLVAANGGVRFKINYNPNYLQVASDYNSFYVGLAQGANVPSTITDIDFMISLFHRIYFNGGVVWSQLYRTLDENNYNNPPSANPANSYLLQEQRHINNVPAVFEYIYATGSIYEIFITSTNDVQFKVNGSVLYTSKIKAYPSAGNPFYLDLLIRATDNIGAAGSISDIELLGTWTS